MKNNWLAALALVALATQIACTNSASKKEDTAPKTPAIVLSELDSTYRPQDDFFEFVNHKWLAANPIPASESSWGIDGIIELRIHDRLKSILEKAEKANAAAGSNEQKIGDFYATAMDSAKRDKEGIAPLKEQLAQIDALTATKDLAPLLATQHKQGVESLFNFFVDVDARNSSAYISQLYQGGLGMPSKDYYLSADKNLSDIRLAYEKHVQKMFQLMGMDEITSLKAMRQVLTIETDLAKVSNAPVDNRDPVKLYNKRDLQELKRMCPEFDWSAYLAGLQLNEKEAIIVNQPAFITGLNPILHRHTIEEWKNYLKWNLINACADELSHDFEQQNFAFYATTLRGVKEMKPRWKRALNATDRLLGEALGQIYVESYFNKATKEKVKVMVDYIIATYKERIMSRDWMSEETKKQAIAKLDKINRKLAYPDHFRDYSKLDIKRDAYVLNTMRANEFEFNRMLSKLGKPIDKNEWGMTPPTINAYYNPTMNEIVFPAGILESPYFNADADDAVNYGAIGAVIGHELTHGFDDEGSQYDADGNLNNWWTDKDRQQFAAKTKQLVNQFNGFVAVDTFHINGRLTLGENIADLGGLVIAYEALKKSQAGKKDSSIDGLTSDQRFFIAYAFSWRTAYNVEAVKQQLKTNPHAPAKQRVNGPIANFDPFYAAFGVKEGDKMYVKPEDRVQIW